MNTKTQSIPMWIIAGCLVVGTLLFAFRPSEGSSNSSGPSPKQMVRAVEQMDMVASYFKDHNTVANGGQKSPYDGMPTEAINPDGTINWKYFETHKLPNGTK